MKFSKMYKCFKVSDNEVKPKFFFFFFFRFVVICYETKASSCDKFNLLNQHYISYPKKALLP